MFCISLERLSNYAVWVIYPDSLLSVKGLMGYVVYMLDVVSAVHGLINTGDRDL